MVESTAEIRIELVESNPELRGELARALSRLGFEVTTAGVAQAPGDRGERARFALRVMDLAADGAEGWLEDGAAAQRCLFLAGDAGDVRRRSIRLGHDLDVLLKPFSIQTLEARVLRRLDVLRTPEGPRHDPLLQTRDPRLGRVFDRVFEVARRECPISLEGEIGTGRRALARAIHAASRRAGEALVVLENTGIDTRHGEGLDDALRRMVASAAGGTLVVVDPVSLPERAQIALQAALRGRAEAVGPRCITLTSDALEDSAREGRLMAELLYALSGARFRLPPLRERREDQAFICTSIARRVARELGLPSPVLEPSLFERLAREGFPGNRLGLESRLRTALMRQDAMESLESRFFEATSPVEVARAGSASLDLRTLERETIVRALDQAKGNRTHASSALGISVRTLRNKIRDYGLR